MKKIIVFSLVFMGFFAQADAATRPTGRNSRSNSGGDSSAAAAPAISARAATNSRTAPRAAAPAANTGAKTVNRGRAATNTASKAPVVAARAGTTQKVIGTGTKVAGAAKNIVVSEECQAKFEGCMDSFCMLDNETGGRCLCSDRNAELDSILAEIEKLDQQSYQMATFGVERIEMGADADAAIASANAAAQSVIKQEEAAPKKSVRKAIDLSAWDITADMYGDDDVFGEDGANELMMSIEGKEGDALYRASAQICVAQIPECSGDLNMLQMMYAQRIKSDCAAYENSLKQQKNASQQKLSTAERALREAALEQLRTANKYDLGQCTVEFKKCMQTTGGCGTDFSGCAIMSALDNSANGTIKSTSTGVKNYQIKGSQSSIEISASTYDALLSKKPLCETVTKSCVAVANQVWDTFLREVAPQIKNAEIIAEDKARQDCVGNISNCFQKACKDNIDPKDPDGSFDMCITRPETMFHVCKVPLNACGIDASSVENAEKSNVWEFVVARLASMRVDSCSAAVKECLQSEDRCGSDYTQCIGLDTDSIIRMCPYDKLLGCQQKYGEKDILGDDVYDELDRLVQGIMLNIDNNFLTECQNAVNEAMIRVCGDTENCDNLTIDDNIGARSLQYKICTDVAEEEDCYASISAIPSDYFGLGTKGDKPQFVDRVFGEINWGGIRVKSDSNKADTAETQVSTASKSGSNFSFLDVDTSGMTNEQIQQIANVDNAISSVVAMLSADETVKQCVYGRSVPGVQTRETAAESAKRFPALLDQYTLLIGNQILSKVRENYTKKYDEVKLAALEELAQVITLDSEREAEDRQNQAYQMTKDECLNTVGNKPIKSGLESHQDYSVNKRGTVYEEVKTATYNQSENICLLCTKHRDCKNIQHNNNDEKRTCKDKNWGEWSETCQEISLAPVSVTADEKQRQKNLANKDNCLKSVGDNPSVSGMTATQDYSVNQRGTVYDEIKTATYNQAENKCVLCTKHRDCSDIKNNGNDKKRRCKEDKWLEWSETCQEITF